MTQKDFEVIAQVINRYLEYMRDTCQGSDESDSKLIQLFEEALTIQNPRFKNGLFEEACLDQVRSSEIREMMREKIKAISEVVFETTPKNVEDVKEISEEEYRK